MKNFILKYYKAGIIILALILLIVILLITFINKSPVNMIIEYDANEENVEILDEASEIEDEGESVIFISKDEVYSFEMTDSNNIILNFELQDDQWVYADDTSIAIDQDRIDKVLNYITDVRFTDVISNEEDDEGAASYGLTQDSPVYILKDANGYSTFISLGNVDEKTGEVYFALNYDFATIYLNSGKLKGVSMYSIEDLVAR